MQVPDLDTLLAQTEVRVAAARTCGCTSLRSMSCQVFCSDSSGARDMAAAWQVPYLGSIPMDPALTRAAEAGRQLPLESLARPALAQIVGIVVSQCTTLSAA
jgi:hypothetical protein